MKYLTYLTTISPHVLLGLLLLSFFFIAAAFAIWA